MASDSTKFDAAKAKAWKMEVDAEFRLVKQLLAKVTEECTSDPIGDDPILIGIENAGKEIDNKWNQLKNAFDTIQEKIGGSFDKWERTINESVDRVEKFKNSFHL